jgi:hypothetical protein
MRRKHTLFMLIIEKFYLTFFSDTSDTTLVDVGGGGDG